MNSAKQQQGLALLMMVFVLVLVGVGYAVSTLNGTDFKQERDRKTALALAEAKVALIGYAVTYDDKHPGELYGYLPCPDVSPALPSGEGAESACSNLGVSVLGRLPWKTLKMEPAKDGNDECLWYAVSGSYKNNPKTADVNPTTLGALEVLALAGAADPAVAVIFSAGVLLPGQNRANNIDATQCGGNYASGNYLDTDGVSNINNAVIAGGFVAAKDSQQFNDKLAIITRSDVFASYCRKYANTLLSYASAANNGCDDGGTPKATCTTASDNLQNCSVACKDAAQTFVSVGCLTNINNPACQTSISELEGCQA